MFTIEVKKKGKDEDFNFESLELFHQECHSGRIEKDQRTISHEPPKWELTCSRCDAAKLVYEEALTAIVATAIDGQERESKAFNLHRDGKGKKYKEGIRIIQK